MTHFLMGICVGVVLYLLGRARGLPRNWQFGGEFLSIGLPSRWILWLLGCICFEILSSCHMPDQYQEMGYSFIEGPIIAAGAFLVDRLCRWHELDEIWTPASSASGVVHDITDRLKETRAQREAVKAARAATEAATKQERARETKAKSDAMIKDFEERTKDF